MLFQSGSFVHDGCWHKVLTAMGQSYLGYCNLIIFQEKIRHL